MLCIPSVVCLILATASSGESPGSKKCSLRNDLVPQFSAKAVGVACSPKAADPSKTAERKFLLLLLFSSEDDALIAGTCLLGQTL